MSHIPRLAAIAVVGLLAGAVQAQTPPAQNPPAPAAKILPAAPGIAPQAQALLDKAFTAHKKLMSLSATLSVETDEDGGAPETQTVMVAFQQLGFQRLAKVAVAGKDGPIQQIVTDGKQITTLSVPDKKYAGEAVPADSFIVSTVLGRAGALIPTVIGHPEALVEILSAGTSAALGPQGVVGGVPVDTIILTLPNTTGRVRMSSWRSAMTITCCAASSKPFPKRAAS